MKIELNKQEKEILCLTLGIDKSKENDISRYKNSFDKNKFQLHHSKDTNIQPIIKNLIDKKYMGYYLERHEHGMDCFYVTDLGRDVLLEYLTNK